MPIWVDISALLIRLFGWNIRLFQRKCILNVGIGLKIIAKKEMDHLKINLIFKKQLISVFK